MYIKKKKQVEREEITAARCDVCGVQVICSELPHDWHPLFTFIGGESEQKHVCSAECYKRELKNTVDDCQDEKDFIFDTFGYAFAKRLAEAI
jgi:hypothetical protein